MGNECTACNTCKNKETEVQIATDDAPLPNYGFESARKSVTEKEYNNDILKSSNDSNKLCTIAKFIRFLVISHFYTDGNLRTCKLLLIKLLIDNNFYPCILKDQDLLRGYLSVSELVKEIIEGINYFIEAQK